MPRVRRSGPGARDARVARDRPARDARRRPGPTRLREPGPIAAHVAAVVVGPGLCDERGSTAFVRRLLRLFRERTVVLDSIAMSVAAMQAFDQPVLLTPHAGEMAHLCGLPKEVVTQEALHVACEAAIRWNACVVLKGASTVIATPQGRAWRFDGGSIGLATSGSGDVLAGLMGGFAARGLPPEQAAAWAVVVHAMAGRKLGRRVGPLGYLARELAGEVPAVVRQIGRCAAPPLQKFTTPDVDRMRSASTSL
ncbi:ADP/ATP-dependent (S)-NAD(P)H-hydrate dehydratase [Variovorax sp. WS11]|uniref:ADP-dependent NAD(P)H-hydrate dehydratase n=1 Tax=Variovorax sp. WS11 TaxID=1105204 RepID=UPI0021599B92|nr:ADP/ATP-dependent (S)-NAD(P)H-hydrate dehydratase [Variovorax sp. WS11]